MSTGIKLAGYVCDCSKDIKRDHSTNYLTRTAVAALPFLGLAEKLRLPLSLGLGALRTKNNLSEAFAVEGNLSEIVISKKALVNSAVSAASVVASLFSLTFGMMITRAHDFSIEAGNLYDHLKNGEKLKAAGCFAKVMNNALYLTVLYTGSSRLATASLALQVAIGGVSSGKEFKDGNYIEGIGHLLMTLIRGRQFVHQVTKLFPVVPTAPKTAEFERVPNVAQYKWSSWEGKIYRFDNVSLEEAKEIASQNPKISYFFYMKSDWRMVLEDKNGNVSRDRVFNPGTAVFFKGTPWWGSADGMADGYIKK